MSTSTSINIIHNSAAVERGYNWFMHVVRVYRLNLQICFGGACCTTLYAFSGSFVLVAGLISMAGERSISCNSLPAVAPVARYSHVAVDIDSKLYIWGGWRKDTPRIHTGREKTALTSTVDVLDLQVLLNVYVRGNISAVYMPCTGQLKMNHLCALEHSHLWLTTIVYVSTIHLLVE